MLNQTLLHFTHTKSIDMIGFLIHTAVSTQPVRRVFSQCDELKMLLLLKSTTLRWNDSDLELVFHVPFL